MNVEVVSQEAGLIELRVDNLTVAEILRVYLNQNGVKFAAWRRDHLTKPIIFRVESSDKNVKKTLGEAIKLINKDLDSLLKISTK